MAQQTAIEWFWIHLPENISKEYFDLFEQAKKMESQQIRFAYNDGAGDQYVGKYKGMYEYYNKKYNDENNQ